MIIFGRWDPKMAFDILFRITQRIAKTTHVSLSIFIKQDMGRTTIDGESEFTGGFLRLRQSYALNVPSVSQRREPKIRF